MPFAIAAAGLVAAITAGASPSLASPPRGAPDLAIHAWRERPPATLADPAPAMPAGPAAPPCLGEVCQPRVSVPGFEPRFSRPSRTELAAVYLERARLEPFATLAWVLLVTGLRVDYAPPVFDDASRAPTRWGSVFVRVKFRVDADSVPVLPRRHRRDRRPRSARARRPPPPGARRRPG